MKRRSATFLANKANLNWKCILYEYSEMKREALNVYWDQGLKLLQMRFKFYKCAKLMSIFIDDSSRQIILCMFFRTFSVESWTYQKAHHRTLRSIKCAKLVSVANKRRDNSIELISRKYRSHGRFALLFKEVIWKCHNTGYSRSLVKMTQIYHVLYKDIYIYINFYLFYEDMYETY